MPGLHSAVFLLWPPLERPEVVDVSSTPTFSSSRDTPPIMERDLRRRRTIVLNGRTRSEWENEIRMGEPSPEWKNETRMGV